MIVDTSAIVAVLLGEVGSEAIEASLMSSTSSISAATRVELGIVVEARTGPIGVQLLDELLDRLAVEIVDVDEGQASEAIIAWRRFGKGRHPAGLNFGDTFAYALAMRRQEPLLFVGDDFSRTDVLRVER